MDSMRSEYGIWRESVNFGAIRGWLMGFACGVTDLFFTVLTGSGRGNNVRGRSHWDWRLIFVMGIWLKAKEIWYDASVFLNAYGKKMALIVGNFGMGGFESWKSITLTRSQDWLNQFRRSISIRQVSTYILFHGGTISVLEWAVCTRTWFSNYMIPMIMNAHLIEARERQRRRFCVQKMLHESILRFKV